MTENKLYPKSYGAWAGNPEGHYPDYTKCCATVWNREGWSRSGQCNRKRGHGPDGAYCKQHDPTAVKARNDAADARGKAQWRVRRYEIHGRRFFEVLKKIAEGHNDARGLAQEVISAFERND